MIYKRDKKSVYEAWLHWEITPRCNMRCTYCIFYNTPGKGTRNLFNKLINSNPKEGMDYIKRSLSRIIYKTIIRYKSRGIHEYAIIKIPELMNTLDNTGKTFRISFTGGEPFLVPNFVETCRTLTHKHYIQVNTNATSDRIREFAKSINPDRVLFIVASLHIKELERLGLLEKYEKNFQLLKNKGFPVFAREVAHPTLAGVAGYYRKFFLKKKIPIQFDPFIGSYNGKEYPQSYTEREMKTFGLKPEEISIFFPRNKPCNAGFNAAVISTKGIIQPCFSINEYLGNIYTGFKFQSKIRKCPMEKCGCPLNAFDPYLYDKAASILLKPNR